MPRIAQRKPPRIGERSSGSDALLPPVYARLAAVAPVRCTSALASSVNELPISETWLVGHRALRAVPRVAAVWEFMVEEFRKFERP